MVIDIDKADETKPSSTKQTSAVVPRDELLHSTEKVPPNVLRQMATKMKEKMPGAMRLPSPNVEPWLEEEYKRIRYERVQDYPMGYPQLAAVINSDDNFRMFRRFGTMRTRLLLHLQAELCRLENELRDLDTKDEISNPMRIESDRGDMEDHGSCRHKLLNKIDEKLARYDALLARARELSALDVPTKRNYFSLFHYLAGENPIDDLEVENFHVRNDFVSLAKEQDSPFHVLLEKHINSFGSQWVERLFVSKAQREAADGTALRLRSKNRINVLVKVIVVLILFFMIIVPVYLLFKLNCSGETKLGILVASVLIFPVVISTFTRARNHDVFAATAAYAAVLVVFLGNFTINSCSKP